jgi:prepilin-type processing-associated H-X9-DG protein
MSTFSRGLWILSAILTMGTFCAAAEAGRTPAEELTGFLPEKTLGFVATNGGDNLKGTFDASSLGKIWHENSVQEFYTQVKGEFSKVLDITFDNDDKDEAEERDAMLDFFKTILKRPALIGAAEKPEGEMPFYVFLIVQAGDRKAEIEKANERLAAIDAEDEVRSVITIGGVKINKAVKDDETVILWGWVGDYFILSINDEEGRIFQNMTAAKLEDLKAKPFEGVAKLTETNDLVIKYFDVERIAKLVTAKVEEEGEGEDENLAMARSVLKSLGLDKVRTMTARAGFSGANMVADAVVGVAEPREGIFKAMGSVELSLLDRVPGNAIEVCAWNIDLAKLYDVVMAAINTANAEKYTKAMEEIGKFEKEAGFKIRQGVLASLAGPMVSYEMPMTGLMGPISANGVFMAKLKDAAMFEQTMKGIEAFIKKEAGGQVQFSRREIDGRTYYFLMVPQLAMAQVTPTLMVAGDWLIVGTSLQQVNAALTATTQPAEGGSIRQTAGFKAVTKTLPKNAICFRYTDQAAKAKQTMLTLQQVWPMVVMGLSQREKKINLPMMLPPAEDIARHLGPAAEYWWFDAEGVRFYGEGAMVMGNLQMAAVVGAGVGIMTPAFGMARGKAMQTASASNLKQIYWGLYEYSADADGEFPDDLKVLVEKEFVSPELLESPLKPKNFKEPSYIYIPGLSVDADPRFIVMYENPAYLRDGTNAAFGDGHVEWIKPKEFREALKITYEALGKPVPEVRFKCENGATSTPSTQPNNCRDIPCGETAVTDIGRAKKV